MRLPHLKQPGDFVEVPRWLPGSETLSHLNGKRVLAETGGKKHHAVKIGTLRIHGPNAQGQFAVDLEFPCPTSRTSLSSYIYHLSAEQLLRLVAVQGSPYDYRYDGVLYADHPFTSSFEAATGA
jgi:hypothetical protein